MFWPVVYSNCDRLCSRGRVTMELFFHESIKNWEDWGRVFQSVSAFSPLVEEIYRREGLPFEPLENLTPGTNAVFRVGNTVAKVFFPAESGLDPLPDFRNEAAVCGRLTELGLSTPRLLASGCVEDRYRFYYILTEFCPYAEAGEWLDKAAPQEKEQLARTLRELLTRLNRPAEGLIPPVDLLERTRKNPRWKQAPAILAADFLRRAETLDLSKKVLVHGDLTRENILVTPEGKPVIIDCADACLAPARYELPPLVFELFRCDPAPLRVFAGSDVHGFAERVLDGLSFHDFGADILLQAAERHKMPMFQRLDQVRDFILERLI